MAVTSLRSGKSKLLAVNGVCPLGVVGGALVYVTAAQTVMAAPFDMSALRVTGTPIPFVSDVLLGTRGACKAALSFDGTLAFERGTPIARLVLRDAQSVDRPILGELRTYAYPRFSPDGKRIALSITSGGRSDVWIYDIGATTLTRLTTEGSINERPEWSPDGRRVLFRSDRGRRSGIWWQRADLSGAATPLVVDDTADIFEGVLSPNGQTAVYQLDNIGADVLYRQLAGDTVAKAVANTASLENMARVSPDGRWVAFVTDASGGERQVVVQPFPGPGAQVQVSTSSGVEPVWSREGHRLYYRDGAKIVAVSWDANPTFHVISRAPLFDDVYLPAASPHAGYDVSPDGTHCVLLQSVEWPQVIVVHN